MLVLVIGGQSIQFGVKVAIVNAISAGQILTGAFWECPLVISKGANLNTSIVVRMWFSL